MPNSYRISAVLFLSTLLYPDTDRKNLISELCTSCVLVSVLSYIQHGTLKALSLIKFNDGVFLTLFLSGVFNLLIPLETAKL